MIAALQLLSLEEAAALHSQVERLALAGQEFRREFFRGWSEQRRRTFWTSWLSWARPGQLPPDGDWRVWLLMAGRGFGKTRAGAEWVRDLASREEVRIALVGPTEAEARAVMIEGASGILACAGPEERPEWEPSLGRLTWPSGARAFVYSGANPEALRGPEHDFAWCDEIAKWAHAEAAWDNLMFGLRRGELPQALATTTPRPTRLLRRLVQRGDVALTKGRTADNSALADGFVDYVRGLYGGTRLGRQELDGELIEEVAGALWTRALIERCRGAVPTPDKEGAKAGLSPAAQPHSKTNPPPAPPCSQGGERFRRVVLGVDPPASAGGTCGIVACGIGADGVGYVLGDHSASGLSPAGWARAVVRAAEIWGASRVAVETNQGGEMVESVLAGADAALPVRPVRARFGKDQRAEPVAALFERGKAKFAGGFPELEDELCGLVIGGGYEGPGRSPDRADAMVWALTELMLGRPAAEPRVRAL